MYRALYGFILLAVSLIALEKRQGLVDFGLPSNIAFGLPIFLFGLFFLYEGIVIYSKTKVRLPYGLTNKSFSNSGKAIYFGVCLTVFLISTLSASSYVLP